ncbi:hypothetical protein ACFQ88_31795 [Paenibacillus sp. NPDC056579]|uniref:hypothetical protein n=1 Tax=unclassified Paenibacillus TaxID=185978 RepID=UPI001EF9220E|nr:hypothetical protein [Paenibacillus sp. H1-7]ULL15126.1 hypothetical protein DVH26_12180 [Paenibacillus sp. H1-7]
MLLGFVEVSITEGLNAGIVKLILNCGYDRPGDLHMIQNRAGLQLKHGKAEREVTFVEEQGDECFFSYIEISPELAKTLAIKDGQRFSLTYLEDTKTVMMKRIVTSTAYGYLLQETRKHRDDVIVIGYALLSKLGIPESVSGNAIAVKSGNMSKRARLIIPVNELDETFRLTSAIRTSLGLASGKTWRLTYNQTTKTLLIASSTTAVTRFSRNTTGTRRISKQ